MIKILSLNCFHSLSLLRRKVRKVLCVLKPPRSGSKIKIQFMLKDVTHIDDKWLL